MAFVGAGEGVASEKKCSRAIHWIYVCILGEGSNPTSGLQGWPGTLEEIPTELHDSWLYM